MAMTTISLKGYLGRISEAWDDYDGEALGRYISFEDPHIMNPKLHVEDPSDAVDDVLEEPLDDIVIDHLKACYHVSNGDFKKAYDHQVTLVQSFVKLLSAQKDDNWPLPMMFSVCLDLRKLAARADRQLTEEAKGSSMVRPGATLEKAAEHMMSCFRTCAIDSKSGEDVTKRWGMLNIVNQLFKIYFKVNKLHLCKPLIRAIEQSPFKDRFPLAQIVTYRYYVGRKYMFDNDFPAAERYLKFAFEHCHRDSVANKRAILIYLIPVRMYLGHMPTQAVLQKYDLLQFSGIVRCVKQGNLLGLNEAMEENEKFFIGCGIFLILERLKIITYRNLFKKVYLLLKTHQLPVHAFLVALQMMKVDDIDADETQCILANLIYEGKIKGYISHQHQKVVVSKVEAFPALAATAQ